MSQNISLEQISLAHELERIRRTNKALVVWLGVYSFALGATLALIV